VSAGTTLYGLANCDTCGKARRWLDRFGIAHAFVDYRANPVDAATLDAWAEGAGGYPALVNRSSSTWRNLPGTRRAPGSAAEWRLLLREYPQLIRRPVVVTADGAVSQGFTDKGFHARFGTRG
jgi:Spx/MgsR family transcriptional regulator